MVTLPGTPVARFLRLDSGTLDVRAENGFGLLYQEVPGNDRGKRQLSWRWLVEQAPTASDLRRKGSDDRPIAIHVWFGEEDEQRGIWRSLGRTAASLLGLPPSGKVLTYVWGGTGVRGDTFANPHLDSEGFIVVLRPGTSPTGTWFFERVDVATDFPRVFKEVAPPVRFLAISADSDDLGGTSIARVADLAFGD
jgi:hypothetical protein